MKRRDFLAASVGCAGLIVPGIGRAQVRPCPPSVFGVDGSNSVSTGCSTGDAETDWQKRIATDGVVWYHDFASDEEVTQFLWSGGLGNDPTRAGSHAQYVRRIDTDGVTGGGCLECFRPTSVGANAIRSYWWRPFAAFPATQNGRTSADPRIGIASTVPQRTWNSANTDQTATFASPRSGPEFSNPQAVYGHASYGGIPEGFDGDEFWLQIRIKMDPRRTTGGNAAYPVGKLVMLTHTTGAYTAQELVTYSYGHGQPQYCANFLAGPTYPNYFRTYIGWSYAPLEQHDGSECPQIGRDADLTATPWAFSGGWDTIMYHVKVGRQSVDESLYEIFAAHEGDSSGTWYGGFHRIWNQTFNFGNAQTSGFDYDRGLNAIILSTYNNEDIDPRFNFPQDFYHRYDQLIFSKNPIACPRV